MLILFVLAVGFWSYQGTIAKLAVQEKLVVLTFDDGPNPPHTQALLDVLESYGVKATFFVKARNVEAFPDALRAVALAGHEIGNHSYHHRPMAAISATDMRQEITRASKVIEGVLGYAPVLFRPPYGAQGIGTRRALAQLNMTSIIMSTHGTDWELTDPEQISAGVLAKIEPGSIILLHDGHGDVDDPHAQDSRAPSVAATGLIIEALHAQGYSFVTVGELMKIAGH